MNKHQAHVEIKIAVFTALMFSRKYAVAAAILAAIALSTNAYAQGNQWDLQIDLSKDKYILHEPIWLDITLTNITTDTLRTHGVRLPNHRKFSIELRDGSGNLMEYHWAQFFLVPSPGNLLLGPGEQDFGSFSLARLFQSYERNLGYSVMSLFPFIPKGTYTVQVFFDDAVSNDLTFAVGEPSAEEKEVLGLIEQASAAWNSNDSDPSVRIFREAVDKYPNSVFAETCYDMSESFSMEARTKREQDPGNFTPVKIRMLEHYPNSGDADEWIREISYGMDQQARKNFLNDLAAAHPNTRCAKYVRVLQDRTDERKAGE